MTDTIAVHTNARNSILTEASALAKKSSSCNTFRAFNSFVTPNSAVTPIASIYDAIYLNKTYIISITIVEKIS